MDEGSFQGEPESDSDAAVSQSNSPLQSLGSSGDVHVEQSSNESEYVGNSTSLIGITNSNNGIDSRTQSPHPITSSDASIRR